MPFITTLCSALSLCPGSQEHASDDHYTTDRQSSVHVSAYHPRQQHLSILNYRDHVLLAPVERYIQSENEEPWWNPSYFGLGDTELAAHEDDWSSPFLNAYHQYMTGGGNEGIAITYAMPPTGQAACLLERNVIHRLSQAVDSPRIEIPDVDETLTAWHEYGHCLYHALSGSSDTGLRIDDDSRYPLELFADAYALTQLWHTHRYDVAERLLDQRDRGLLLGDTAHWTRPGIEQWYEFLSHPDNQTLSMADLEVSLTNWVNQHPWVSIRDAHLQAR